MNSVPLVGKGTIEYFSDDTIETLQQHIALAMNSHPDRLFVLVKAVLPADYYSADPRHWKNLFLRMSLDGNTVSADMMRTYLELYRPGTGASARAWTLDEWEREPDEALFKSDRDFSEWRILGVEEERSWVLPVPVADIEVPASRVPAPRRSRLVESLHPYPIAEIRAVEADAAQTVRVRAVYFPYLTEGTPTNIESLRSAVEGARKKLSDVLALHPPVHTGVAILRAKWYVPFVNTEFPRKSGRTRFEQIFYGMSVNEDTPHVAFFTGKDETVRHKFYVKDAKTKTPHLPTDLVKGWYSVTQPQRRLPTLLLYRGHGKNRANFDRIAVTIYDMTITAVRSKDDRESLEEIRASLEEWVKSLDALMPFVREEDMAPSRWELNQLNAQAFYSKEVRTYDLRRFACLRSVFEENQGKFVLLRADTTTNLTPQEFQAFVLLRDAEMPSSKVLETEMELSPEAASALFAKVSEMTDEINVEKEVREFPVLEFGPKEVTIRFVSNLERVLRYADILRYVLSSDAAELNAVCPLRMEVVPAASIVPQQVIAPAPAPAPEVSKKKKKILDMVEGGGKVVKATETRTKTYNYFNERVQKFDPKLFNNQYYPKKCEKSRQVIVLTPEDEARIRTEAGEQYVYSGAPATETYPLPIDDGPEGKAICPPFWCMRDEIPLLEDQLVVGGAGTGEKQCPVCGGKIRKVGNEDLSTHTVIEREKAFKYPDLMEVTTAEGTAIKFPCCYKRARGTAVAIAPKASKAEEDDTYVLSDRMLPARRLGYISEETVRRLGLITKYGETTISDRLASNKEDVFRVGLGRPSQTLPLMLKGDPIKSPKEAPERVKECSFYGTWTLMGKGDTQEERIIDGIDNAFQTGRMNVLDEVEYATRFLRCSVMRVNSQTNQLICGFWSDVAQPMSRTIMLIDNDILALVKRRAPVGGIKFEYTVDIRELPFGEGALDTLRSEYAKACASNLPSMDDALRELQVQGKKTFEVVLDPLGRAQALLVPRDVILPFRPAPYEALEGVTVRNSYADVPETDLPVGDTERMFLENARHPGFKVKEALHDVDGNAVELLLESGFRVPIVPEGDDAGSSTEVVQTVMRNTEASLVSGEPNADDTKKAQEIAYSAEVAEFMLFSLSKDIGAEGPEKYKSLRKAIREQNPELRDMLAEWMSTESYWDKSKSPIEFISKVRTPCGQFTRKDACNKSSLCGWHNDSCKIRVKPVLDKRVVLNRLVKTLTTNAKQRALVLDERLSPFFSTILYLELPHELITTAL
jgi:hypothetical protein